MSADDIAQAAETVANAYADRAAKEDGVDQMIAIEVERAFRVFAVAITMDTASHAQP